MNKKRLKIMLDELDIFLNQLMDEDIDGYSVFTDERALEFEDYYLKLFKMYLLFYNDIHITNKEISLLLHFRNTFEIRI